MPRQHRAHSSLTSTREREAARITDTLSTGASVLVSGIIGDGIADLASQLSGPSRRPFRCTRRTTAEEVTEYLDTDEPEPLVFSSVEELAGASFEILEDHLYRSTRPLVMTADDDLLDSSGAGGTDVLGTLLSAWRRGELDVVRVGRIENSEVERILQSAGVRAVLDDLQLEVLLALADGQPQLAQALALDALDSPESAPRRYPVPGLDSMPLGLRASSLLRARLSNVPPTQARAARELARIGPVPQTTARYMFGPSVVSQLLDRRLACSLLDDGAPAVAIPAPLAAVNDLVADERSDNAWRGRLEGAFRMGYPLGEVASYTLARATLEGEPLTIDDDQCGLLLRAARVANKFGSPREARAFGRLVMAHAPSNSPVSGSVQAQLCVAAMELGEHGQAVAIAKKMIAETKTPSPEMLVSAAVALSWTAEAPGWWNRLLEGPVADHLPTAVPLLRALATTDALDGALAARFASVLEDATAPLSLKMMTAAILGLYYLVHSESDALLSLFATVERTAQESYDPHRYTDDPFETSCVFLFDATRVFILLNSGIAPRAADMGVTYLLRRAARPGRNAGWLATCVTALVTGLRQHQRGVRVSAMRDLQAAKEAFHPALPLPLARALSATTQFITDIGDGEECAEDRNGDHPFQTGSPNVAKPAGAFLPAVSRRSSVVPRWALTAAAHGRYMAGALHAAEALAMIPAQSGPAFPVEKALAAHLEAAAKDDAETLLDVGRELASLGGITPARAALRQAHRILISTRAAAQAKRAVDMLAGLSNDVPADLATDEPAPEAAENLSPREVEICVLVSEGLTNQKIADRLFLSARTVESHVLSARAKLGAARRQDLPGLFAAVRALTPESSDGSA